MYRRPKFLEVLIELRQQMAREADFDMNRFVEMLQSGEFTNDRKDSTPSSKKETIKASQNKKSKIEELENSKI